MFQTLVRLSLASTVSAGLLGAVVGVTVGPELAMALAILGGNTEPVLPSASFPWLAAVGSLMLCGFGVWVEVRRSKIVGMVVAHLGAVLLVLLPFVHLVVLWRRT